MKVYKPVWQIQRLRNRCFRVTCCFAGFVVQRRDFATRPAADAYRDAFVAEFSA
jgi:hypothetical protein